MDLEKVQRADETEKLSRPVEGWVSTSRMTFATTSYKVSGSMSLMAVRKSAIGIWK